MSAARWRQRIQYQLAVLPILLLPESNGVSFHRLTSSAYTLCPDWRWPDHRCDVFQHRNDGAFNRRRGFDGASVPLRSTFCRSRRDGCPYAFVSGRRRPIRNSGGAGAKLENVTSSNGCNLASYRDFYIDKRQRGAHADSSASRVEAASRLAKTREDDSQPSKRQGGCDRREIP